MDNLTHNETSIEARVRAVIAQAFRLSSEEAQGELRMGNPAKWDSLGHMELVMKIEKEFGIQFPNFVISELVSVPAITRAIEETASS